MEISDINIQAERIKDLLPVESVFEQVHSLRRLSVTSICLNLCLPTQQILIIHYNYSNHKVSACPEVSPRLQKLTCGFRAQVRGQRQVNYD